METLQPKLRFPEFKGNWKIKNLREITSLITKGTTPKEFVESGITYIKTDCFINNKIELKRCSFIDESVHLKELKRSIINENDLLFTITGATIGKCVAVDKCVLPANTNQNLAIIRLNKGEDKNYIFQNLTSERMNKYILDNSTIGAQPSLNLEQIGSFSFPYPILEEQTKIANFLSSVDEKINLLKEKKSLLEEYKKGIMQKIFNQDIRFKDDNGEDFEEWEEFIISELVEVIVGGTPNTTKDEYWNGNIPWLSSGELNNGLVTKAKKYITESGLKNSSAKIMKANTVLLAMTGATLGKMGFLTFNSTGNQSIAGFQPNDNYNSKFLFYVLLFNKNTILSMAGGAAQQGINKASIESLIFSFCSLEEQTKIANFLSSIDEKIELVNTQIQDIQEYKKGLLQQLFV